jgi:hypothetical protein
MREIKREFSRKFGKKNFRCNTTQYHPSISFEIFVDCSICYGPISFQLQLPEVHVTQPMVGEFEEVREDPAERQNSSMVGHGPGAMSSTTTFQIVLVLGEL